MAGTAFDRTGEGLIVEAEEALRAQLADKPRRLEHSLSVATTAVELAGIYGVDALEARLAGTLHDWCKALPAEEQIRLCKERGISFGVDLELVAPLLHGPLAADMLPEVFPWITTEITEAISSHTIGSTHMSALDMVVFVADYIEPLRPSTPAIERTRSLVGKVALGDLCLEAAVGSISFVLETKRYLYPATIETYNALVKARARRTGDIWVWE